MNKLKHIVTSLELSFLLHKNGLTSDYKPLVASWAALPSGDAELTQCPTITGVRVKMPNHIEEYCDSNFVSCLPALTFDELISIAQLGNEWSIGWSDACCGYTIYWGNRGAGAMLKHKGIRSFWYEHPFEDDDMSAPYDSPLRAMEAMLVERFKKELDV